MGRRRATWDETEWRRIGGGNKYGGKHREMGCRSNWEEEEPLGMRLNGEELGEVKASRCLHFIVLERGEIEVEVRRR